MNSYQMVLHRPVETARHFGNFSHSLQTDPRPSIVIPSRFSIILEWQNPLESLGLD